jgi:hypothetical protein
VPKSLLIAARRVVGLRDAAQDVYGIQQLVEPELLVGGDRARHVAPALTSESFKLSTDPFLAEKARDVVGLYLNPPEHAMVLCVDEKSGSVPCRHSNLRTSIDHLCSLNSDSRLL